MSAATSTSVVSTIVEMLRYRAQASPEREACSFLIDGDTAEETLTYAQLDRRARGIAACLQEEGQVGDRVIILCPAGLDYTAAFFGSIYGGLIAVPAYADRAGNDFDGAREMLRLSGARLGLTTSAVLATMERELPDVRWLAVDQLPEGSERAWRAPPIEPGTIAYLMFTSGSTGAPRAVMVTHGNLILSPLDMSEIDLAPEGRFVNWVAPRAAGGLGAGIIRPIVTGMPATTMTPEDFAARPARWLEVMSRTRATICTFPNFAYDLAVDTVPPEQREKLDLSHWQHAFNGGDQVRADTIKCFEAAFAVSGLKPGTMHTAYGMSEAGGITGNAEPPRILTLDRATLRDGFVAPSGDDDGRVVVSVGTSPPTQQVIIVEPESATKLAENRVGEIWTAGPHVTAGYWDQPEETEKVFHAYLSTGEGPFLRTGDLGFLSEGYLYITGRLRELIIVRGRKLYPQEIELTVEGAYPGLRRHSNAAFDLDEGGDDRLVVVQEVANAHRETLSEVGRAIEEAVVRRHAVRPHTVALVPPGAIPRAHSGKILRGATKAHWLDGTLDVVAKSPPGGWSAPAIATPSVAPRTPTEKQLEQVVRAVLRIERIGIHDNLFALGADSLAIAQITAGITDTLGVSLPQWAFFDAPTLAGLADICVRPQEATPPENEEPSVPPSQVWELQAGAPDVPPLYWIDGGYYCRRLVVLLRPDRPMWMVQGSGEVGARGYDFRTIAASRIAALRTVRPHGPYLLAGYCEGVATALEMARQLRAQGQQVAFLGLVEPVAPIGPIAVRIMEGLSAAAKRVGIPVESQRRWYIRVGQAKDRLQTVVSRALSAAHDRAHVLKSSQESGQDYREGVGPSDNTTYDGPVTMFYTRDTSPQMAARRKPWEALTPQREIVEIDGSHHTILTEHLASLVFHLEACLDRIPGS